MKDILAPLQAAVGDAYRIERELGGGGMSHVFQAVETALDRRVVIKVLPPELAAGVNMERFRREVQLAASLQHPHVVQLLTAGSSGDLLYYIMPYIAGESLRTKLAREGELPVAEAVRILCDVVDALAYAHGQGVVHRDIKPDNVLLSGKHAVVTDFGVAKAVSASSGGSSLTSLGVALGTPAYMAPEQAAAGPHVDHRADLYAVGALAYEMLTGRPPFSAPTPQAMLAAHMTMAPEPVTKHRQAVSAALNELIMRCLEKHPADRWQRADDLLVQLEAMATPSGGMTPTATAPVPAIDAEAEARRGHPVRVASLFGLASVAVLAVVYFLVIKLGLPDWVFAGAIVLLVAGLPIMVVTGVLERRRALARTAGMPRSPPSGGWHAWFTWRKAILGGVLAFAGLGALAVVYTAMRLLGIGPVGTLVASGVIKNREPLLLASFENRTADSTLGPSLTEAFRIDLSQSPTVKLVDAQHIAEALQRMQRPAGTSLGLALARELAQREGIKAIVTGQIDPIGKGYVFSASLVSAADGQVLAAARETAEDDKALIRAIDRVSRKLRERIGESLTTIRANEPLERVTTASLEALRKYTQGARAEDQGNSDQAAALLEEATALDTGFAMAYRKLAVVLDNSGAARDRVVAAVTKGYAHRDRLPEIERHLTTAYYYWDADYDPAKIIAAYRSALERDPDNQIALNNLALALGSMRRWREAESLAVRAIALGPGWTFHNLAMTAQVAQGRYADAQATLEHFARTMPQSPRLRETRAFLLSSRNDYAAAERELRHLREEQLASQYWRATTSLELANLDLVRGKLGQAEQHRRDFMAESEQRGLPRDYLFGALAGAWIDLRYRSKPSDGLKRIEAALERHPLASIPAADRPYVPLAGYFARAGHSERAKRLLAESEKEVPEGIRRGLSLRHAAEAEIAIAEGRVHDAIAGYRAWYDENEFGCATCGLFELAGAFEQARQADSALVIYERIVSTPGLWRLWDDAYGLPPTYKRLGELYEERGDRAKALDSYNRFVELWKDADPELQPVVRDVRARIARLAGER